MPLKLIKRGPYWHLRGTVRGVSVRETTGCVAREAAEEVRIKREAEIVARSIHGPGAAATFLEAAVMYLEHGGETRYAEKLTNYFATTKLARIDQGAIDTAAKALYPHAAPSTLNRQVYTPVGAILHFAAERGLCEHRPIRRPKQPKGRIKWLRPEEAERLIEASSPHLRPLVTFLLYTGARLSEAVYLDWRDIDLQRGQVWFTDTKNGEARGVPLHDRLVAELANLDHREGAVFRRPGTKSQPLGEPYKERDYGGGQIKTAWLGACRRAGLADKVKQYITKSGKKRTVWKARYTPHDLRHTWATWHYAANRNLTALMELGGWKSEAMVMRYAHVNTEHLKASIDALPGGTKSAQAQAKAS